MRAEVSAEALSITGSACASKDSQALRARSEPPATDCRMRSVRVRSRRTELAGTRRSPTTPKNARR